LGHEAIIGYTGRPWRNANEMNGALLANALEVLRPTDTLYVLGDFAFQPDVFLAYQDALLSMCKVEFLHGNHDPKKFASLHRLAADLRWNKRHYYICHYPWQSFRPNTVMIHGHCHGNEITQNEDQRQQMRYDVGVDAEWEGRRYYPVSVEQIERRIDSVSS